MGQSGKITVIKTQPMRSRTSALPVAGGRAPSRHGFGQGMAGGDLGERGGQGGGGLAGGADRGGQVPGQPGISSHESTDRRCQETGHSVPFIARSDG